MRDDEKKLKELAWRAYMEAPTHRDCGRSKVDAAVDAVYKQLLAYSGALHIPRSANLDPIYCYFEDFSPGVGRITVACFGDAWTGAWSGMGARTVREFVADCDPGYLSGSMLQLCGANERRRAYTCRVAAAVIAALKSQPLPEGKADAQ